MCICLQFINGLKRRAENDCGRAVSHVTVQLISKWPLSHPLFSLLVCNIFPLSLSSLRVRTFPKDSALLGRDTVRALMYYALKVWSDIAPLNFHEVAGSDADIQIDFTKADHNDGYPFDGPGGTVAHAFFPGERFTAGDTHFDDDEAWTFRSPGEDLVRVECCAHEIL